MLFLQRLAAAATNFSPTQHRLALRTSSSSTSIFEPKISTFEPAPDSPNPLIIHQFPCLNDNYGFIVHSPATQETAAIDSPCAASYLSILSKKNYTLTHIFNTHHHDDHMGGNDGLLKSFPSAKLLGPVECKPKKGLLASASRIFSKDYDATSPSELKSSTLDDVTIAGGHVEPFGNTSVYVLDTPGHTLHHVSLYFPGVGACFVGDTIFR